MELYPRMFFFGSPLNKDETQELCEVTRSFTAADACYYGSVARRNRDLTCLHEFVPCLSPAPVQILISVDRYSEICDACAGRIGGGRVVCLDCDPHSQETLDTIDLCDRPTCVSCTVPVTRREDLDSPHLPTHHLMKLYTVLHMRQYGRVERAAKLALKRVNRWIASGLGSRIGGGGVSSLSNGLLTPMRTTFLPAISISESSVDGMSIASPLVESRDIFICRKCEQPVTLPCWYCVACPGMLHQSSDTCISSY